MAKGSKMVIPWWAVAGGAGVLFLALNKDKVAEAAADAEAAAEDVYQTLEETVVSIATGNPVAWAVRLYGVIDSILPELQVRSKALIVAHAAFESGWGTGWAAKNANNLFNVTAGQWWLGMGYPVIAQPNGDLSYNVDECNKKGRPMTTQPWGPGGKTLKAPACFIDQIWRVYPDINACVRDYWEFLGPDQNYGRYVSARQALEDGNPLLFGQRLYAAGYFTLDPVEYQTSISSIMNKYILPNVA